MTLLLHSAIADFGAAATAKLSNIAASGQAEDQLRAPLEQLLGDMAELCGFPRAAVSAVGESPLAALQTRPDYAITVHHLLVGFIEIKAPGKGADPRRFKEQHDKEQWKRLQSIPNLIYTDGNEFSRWQNGELVDGIVHLVGDVATSGAKLAAPATLLSLFDSFLRWEPVAPADPKQLAQISARLCRLLRDEVAEQLALRNPALTELATDWRTLLFPDASDERFADGYAQAVTFGLLMARSRDIPLGTGLDRVATLLSQANSLIGSALRLLTDDAENQASLKTSLGTLVRVLDVVNWQKISKGHPDAWLYFYENFLEIYDNDLRKQTGSYYTPPEVVEAMVRLVDEVLRDAQRFNLFDGLASPVVTIADPAVGTGTFLLGALRKIAEIIAHDQGEGAVAASISEAMHRLIGFELQLGPFAVAQLRLLAELADLCGSTPNISPRIFVTDTLSNPYFEQEHIPHIFKPIAESRRQANEIKREVPITVVIGNPPYKEKAKGRGGWIEAGSANSPEPAPLNAWLPPPAWGLSAHVKHLHNLYVYFWRWATWKVFDHDPKSNNGIVCFITVAGFLNGPGFQKMREYLRRTADEIWVIDCSPEGHRPEVNKRIFEGVQQPVCIVLASRSPHADTTAPAIVRFRSLPAGQRQGKFTALAALTLASDGWVTCPSDWRAAFLPVSTGDWSTYPALEDLFLYNGSGVMPGRTWVIAPDAESLDQRWQALINATGDQQESLFHPHLNHGKLGDRYCKRIVHNALPGYEPRLIPIADEKEAIIPPIRYGFRSFDRQWIIPDIRVINRPNPELWEVFSQHQVYLTALSRTSPSVGPALTFSAYIPDLDHYNGRGGRVFPLWKNREASTPNVSSALIDYLSHIYQQYVTAEDIVAYLAALAAHPAYTARFQDELKKPGLRVPLTANRQLFLAAVELGRTIIWLHTFGERFVDPGKGRPFGPPRLAPEMAPRIPKEGAISQDPKEMPDTIDYHAEKSRLLIGRGYVEGVSLQVWHYEVSGKQVLRQWFSYRKAHRDRPIIGDRRPPSKLGDIQPDHWIAAYTTELLNLLHILGRLVALEPAQAELLQQICAAPTLSLDELHAAESLFVPETETISTKAKAASDQILLIE